MVNHIQKDKAWKEVIGLSYMENEVLVNNRLRPLEPDLDQFPYPVRSDLKE